MLLADFEETHKTSKKARIERKLSTAREQIKRAEWLLEQVSED
jgi:hypothetical protein